MAKKSVKTDVVTREELEQRAERISQKLLGVSRKRAFTMLKNGKLRGTLAEMSLSPIRSLLG